VSGSGQGLRPGHDGVYDASFGPSSALTASTGPIARRDLSDVERGLVDPVLNEVVNGVDPVVDPSRRPFTSRRNAVVDPVDPFAEERRCTYAYARKRESAGMREPVKPRWTDRVYKVGCFQ